MVMLIDPLNLPGACAMGRKDAERFLTPTGKRALTIQEAFDAGMPALWIAWFLSTQIENDETALPALLDGVIRTSAAYGQSRAPRTAEQALLALNEVLVARIRQLIERDGHARDAKDQAFDEVGGHFAAAMLEHGVLTTTKRKGTRT